MERLNKDAWKSLVEDCSINLFEQGGTVPPPGTPPPSAPIFTSQMAQRQSYGKPVSSAADSGNFHVPSDQFGWDVLWNYVTGSPNWPQGGFGYQQFWNYVQSAGAGFDWSIWGFEQASNGNWQVALGNPPGSAGMISLVHMPQGGGWNFYIAIP